MEPLAILAWRTQTFLQSPPGVSDVGGPLLSSSSTSIPVCCSCSCSGSGLLRRMMPCMASSCAAPAFPRAPSPAPGSGLWGARCCDSWDSEAVKTAASGEASEGDTRLWDGERSWCADAVKCAGSGIGAAPRSVGGGDRGAKEKGAGLADMIVAHALTSWTAALERRCAGFRSLAGERVAGGAGADLAAVLARAFSPRVRGLAYQAGSGSSLRQHGLRRAPEEVADGRRSSRNLATTGSTLA